MTILTFSRILLLAYSTLAIRRIKFFPFLLIPFAIMHAMYIQKKYKRITLNIKHTGSTNDVLSKLKLLQAYEEYYRSQFSAWGKYHGRFAYSPNLLKRHKKMLKLLFPEKDFKQEEIVLRRSEWAIVYYRNEIYRKCGGLSPNSYHYEKERKDWEKENGRDY